MLTFMLNIGLVSTVAAKSGDPLVAVGALIEAARVECGGRSAADTVTGLDTRVELERCDVWVDEQRGSFTVRSIVPAATAAEAPNAAALAGSKMRAVASPTHMEWSKPRSGASSREPPQYKRWVKTASCERWRTTASRSGCSVRSRASSCRATGW